MRFNTICTALQYRGLFSDHDWYLSYKCGRKAEAPFTRLPSPLKIRISSLPVKYKWKETIYTRFSICPQNYIHVIVSGFLGSLGISTWIFLNLANIASRNIHLIYNYIFILLWFSLSSWKSVWKKQSIYPVQDSFVSCIQLFVSGN